VTFSIVARSGDGQACGVAVASKYLAAAAMVSAAEAGVGALATQAWANLSYKPLGLAALETGSSAADCITALTTPDPQRADRQLGVVAASGPGASYTGPDCMPWAGGVAGLDDAGGAYAIQGNILTGPEVVEAMRTAWLGSDPATGLARRLLAALLAGDAAGGDRRGRQSAGLLVASFAALEANGPAGPDVECDLRVDDHPQAATELARLLELHELYHGSTQESLLLPLEGELADEVAGRLKELGHVSLDAWAAMENFENRLCGDRIDPLVLGRLRAANGDLGG
jgi:uncharacterized Ntn-hydrolase superfamily protein